MVRPMNGVVLVLNQNYEPLNVCNIPRAFRLVFGSKAEVIEYDHAEIRTVRGRYRAPSVIRLQHQIRRPRPRVKLTRREIFVRDRHTCQYCGRPAHDLTLDHVVPRHRGGGHTWENLVAACKPCNHRKGGRTPEEARMRLIRAAVRAAQRPLLAVHAVPRGRPQRGLAGLPVPRPELRLAVAAPDAGAARARGDVPASVVAVLDRLREARSRRLRRRRVAARRAPGPDAADDWDLATDALPERLVELFPGAVYENRFGTVAVRARRRGLRDHDRSGPSTSTRTSGGPTGSSSGPTSPRTSRGATSRSTRSPGGAARRATTGRRGARRPVRRRGGPRAPGLLRAVGDPATRFHEDALRMVRAVRLAATLGFDDRAGDARGDPRERRGWSAHLSGERVGAELEKLLAAPRPSIGLRLAETTGLLAVVAPELAAQRGMPQNKVPGRGPLGPHAADRRRGARRRGPSSGSRRWSTTSASRRRSPTAGSTTTTSSARELAEAWLRRLRMPAGGRSTRSPTWSATTCSTPTRRSSDAAIRRFLGRIGPEHLDALFALRRADDIGSGAAARRPGGSSRSAPASTPSWPPRPCSTGARSRSTATT